MKLCAGCEYEYDEEFNFCPQCGHKFGGQEKEDLEHKMNQHLYDMKRQASFEGALSRRVFSGQGLGDNPIGNKVFGQEKSGTDL